MAENKYSKTALAAMKRAAKKAVEKAAEKNMDIPEWRDGKVVYVNARKRLEQMKNV